MKKNHWIYFIDTEEEKFLFLTVKRLGDSQAFVFCLHSFSTSNKVSQLALLEEMLQRDCSIYHFSFYN